MWTIKDYGLRVNWSNAQTHCQNLILAGNSRWRLPTIDELGTLYDRSAAKQIESGIDLSTGMVWSGTRDETRGESRGLYQSKRDSFHLSYDDGRALCVRP